MKILKPLLAFALTTTLLTTQLLANSLFEKCELENPYHILVNKTHSLAATYKPNNLVIPNVTFQTPGNIEKNYMEKTAATALEKMFTVAKSENIKLVAVSGYRSYTRQTQLYNNAIKTHGKNQNSSAAPGQSEHQLGLAMDVNDLSESFGNTKAGKWLAENAHLYGFIIRYPKNKTHITGYIYEPWHIRYVGPELATYCYTNDKTLEEIDTCCKKDIELEMQIISSETPISATYSMIKRGGLTYIKLRDLMEPINGTLEVQGNIITAISKTHLLTLDQASSELRLDGIVSSLNPEPFTRNHSIYVPIRSTLNLLGFNLNTLNTYTLQIVNKR